VHAKLPEEQRTNDEAKLNAVLKPRDVKEK